MVKPFSTWVLVGAAVATAPLLLAGGEPCVPSDGVEPVTFTFEGLVEQAFDGLGLLDGRVGPGSRFHGSLTLDPSTPDTGVIAEGQFGVFVHESPPSGARLVVGPLTVRTAPREPDLLVFVNDEVGFAGADEFGFVSRNNEIAEPEVPGDIYSIDFRWSLQELFGNPVQTVELPKCPPSPAEFENNDLRLRIDCVPCAGPASFIEIEGRVTRLESERVLLLAGAELRWNSSEHSATADLLFGDLGALGDFRVATQACVADDVTGGSVSFPPIRAPGVGWWFLIRSVYPDSVGSWDSGGLRQHAQRDDAIAQSGAECP